MDIPAARRNVDLAYGALSQSPPDVPRAKKRLIDIKNALAPDAPPPPVLMPPKRGAMVVTAGSCDPSLLRRAGVTEVAVDYQNPNNLADLRTARWDGFNRGLFYVSRGGNFTLEASEIVNAVFSYNLGHIIVDTESHKTDVGGSRAWTENLYQEIRRLLGPSPFAVRNITYGIHQSPAVFNHDALRRWDITAVWEAYDGFGATTGVSSTAQKMNGEGWNPANLALGDKNLIVDCASLRDPQLRALVGELWLWAPEQAGTDVLALGTVTP